MVIPGWRFDALQDQIDALHPAEVRRECRLFAEMLLAGADSGSAYQIANSLLFRGAQYLSRPQTGTGATKAIFLLWLRRAALSTRQYLLSFGAIGSDDAVRFDTGSDALEFYGSGQTTWNLKTTAVMRDPTAWYPVLISYDSTQVTASDRIWIYLPVGGTFQKVTAYATASYPAQNQTMRFAHASYTAHLGASSSANNFNGQISETVLIEGKSIQSNDYSLSSFVEQDAITGNWRPKTASGITWGANGCYLGKPWNSTSLGADYSGQGNNWTPSGFSTSDVLTDSPTNVFATLNPLIPASLTGSVTYSDGNSKLKTASAAFSGSFGSLQIPSSGKWYFEAENLSTTSGTPCLSIGLADAGVNLTGNHSTMSGVWCFSFQATRYLNLNGISTTYAASGLPINTTCMVAVDVDNGKVWFGFGGNWYSAVNTVGGDPASGTSPTVALNAAGKFPFLGNYGTITNRINFGQGCFTHTPPTGFKSLCTANIPTPTSAAARQPWKYYDCQTVVHDGTSTAFTLGWNPNPASGGSHTLFRVKNLSAASWYWHDTVRGIDKFLNSDSTVAETTSSTHLTNLTTSGASLGSGQAAGIYLVEAWRVAPEAGFDIVLDNGTGVAKTVNHTNGAKPGFIIRKCRNLAAKSWPTYHQSVGATKCANLSDTGGYTALSTRWNDTEPTSTVFTVGTHTDVNDATGQYVTYVWSPVPEFSAFGSDIGNASADGTLDWLGFTTGGYTRKRTDSTSNWGHWTTANNPVNPVSKFLALDISTGEQAYSDLDLLSSSVKQRSTSYNGSGTGYIYAAWARAPLGATTITPTTAR